MTAKLMCTAIENRTFINVGAFKSYNFSEVIGWQSKLYEELIRIGGKGWQL